MSERFSDEVLREAHHAYTLVWDVTLESSRDVDRANAAAIAAMRAVLEGHLAERFAAARQLGDWPEHCEQRAFVDGAKWWEFRKTGGTMWAQDVSIAEYVAVERYGEPVAASDGLRHDSIKPTSGRLLSAMKVKKASDGSRDE